MGARNHMRRTCRSGWGGRGAGLRPFLFLVGGEWVFRFEVLGWAGL